MNDEKPVQFFDDDYLDRCKSMTSDQIIDFLENFRKLMGQLSEKCKLISIKVQPSLLDAFKTKAMLKGVPYQRQIKKLMKDWIKD